MALQRDYLKELNELKKGFPVVAVTGARQVWKTTFLKEQFPDYKYFNLESPDTLSYVESDPWKFLRTNSHIIIDEIMYEQVVMKFMMVGALWMSIVHHL